jgi:hypothetical protein
MKKLLPSLLLTLCASATLAEPPATAAAEQLVLEKIVAPLRKIESKRNRFSRAAPVAIKRRVRVLDGVSRDDRGKEFVRFAIDMQRSRSDDEPWENDVIIGCVYPHESEVFVRREDAYFPASLVTGREPHERPGVCHAHELAQAAPEPRR